MELVLRRGRRNVNLLDFVNGSSCLRGRHTRLGNIVGGSCRPPFTLSSVKDYYAKDLFGHYGCVNSIEFDRSGELMASGGDDKRVLLWKTEEVLSTKYKYVPMNSQHLSNIFCLSFSAIGNYLLSGGNDEQVIVHDLATSKPQSYFTHNEVVYGIDTHPSHNETFASACSDGKAAIYDLRTLPQSRDEDDTKNYVVLLASNGFAFHKIVFNPTEPNFLATANQRTGIQLWDIRNPRKAFMEYGKRGRNSSPISAMAVDFNRSGTHLVGLRRRLPPVLFDIKSSNVIAEFDNPGYYNNCTMKSIRFAGYEDEYVITGSDDFRIYLWKIPQEAFTHQEHEPLTINSADIVFGGHRSIVNHVRFNEHRGFIASCGVEKIIKLWSPYNLPGGSFKKNHDIVDRLVYNHDDYISIVVRRMFDHDYSTESTLENPRMMAFFDSLVHREIEGISDEDRTDSSADEFGFFTDEEEEESQLPLNPNRSTNLGDHSEAQENQLSGVKSIFELIESKRRQMRRIAANRKRKQRRAEQMRRILNLRNNQETETSNSPQSSPTRLLPSQSLIDDDNLFQPVRDSSFNSTSSTSTFINQDENSSSSSVPHYSLTENTKSPTISLTNSESTTGESSLTSSSDSNSPKPGPSQVNITYYDSSSSSSSQDEESPTNNQQNQASIYFKKRSIKKRNYRK